MQLTQICHCDGVLSNYWNILLWKKISQRTVILSLQWTKLSGENGKKVHSYQLIIPLPLYQCWIISILFDFNFEHLWGCHLCYNYQFSPLFLSKIVDPCLWIFKIAAWEKLSKTDFDIWFIVYKREGLIFQRVMWCYNREKINH